MSIQIGDNKLYTVSELSQLLGIRERTVRAYIKAGKFRGKKVGKMWYVPETNLLAYFGLEESRDGESRPEE